MLSWNCVKNLQSFNDFYLKIGITFDGSVIGHPVDKTDLSCKMYNSCMVTSFDGKGVILIGGFDYTNARVSDSMLEMHSLHGMNWKVLDTRLKHGRKGHDVLTTSSDKCQTK